LNEKIELSQEKEHQAELKKQQEKAKKATSRSRRREKSVIEKVTSSSAGKTIIREVTRGLLGALGIRTSRRRRSKNSWF